MKKYNKNPNTKKGLEVFCREWQKTLRLQDWEIKVLLSTKDDIPDNSHALISFNEETKSAIISVLNTEDWDNEIFEQDQEKAIVHELIHLHIGFTEKTDRLSRIHEEQSCEILAEAMIILKRK